MAPAAAPATTAAPIIPPFKDKHIGAAAVVGVGVDVGAGAGVSVGAAVDVAIRMNLPLIPSRIALIVTDPALNLVIKPALSTVATPVS